MRSLMLRLTALLECCRIVERSLYVPHEENEISENHCQTHPYSLHLSLVDTQAKISYCAFSLLFKY